EKKDEVFAALKKNKKITPENIPAATQLFTPNWIVRYLVENSLGRLWLLNRPGSKLVEQMKYYIKPEQAETDFLNVGSPEELKICDPACGSGHMLTYAFDLLYAIYEEEGYEPAEIPEKILTHNLYGVEIDERAGELAAFALTMKAREKQRRFFRKPVQPNICVLESVRFEDGELKDYLDFVGRDLFTEPLRETLHQFREADNFGSLIRPAVTDVGDVLALLEEKDVAGQLFLYQTHQKVLKVLKQTDYLSPQYHVVVTNPPYMGVKGMNGRLGAWAKDNYPNSKSDLFAMFIERGLELVPRSGYSGMVTMQSWMFLSSYEHLRARLLTQTAIESMAHMANMVMGIAFGTAATVWKIGGISRIAGAFCYVEYEDIGSENKPTEFPPLNDRNIKAPTQDRLYRVAAEEFRKVAGSPIAYWISSSLRSIFSQGINLEEYSSPRQGLSTTNNDLFLRQWFEVDINKISLASADKDVAGRSGCKWFPYSKGGEGRRWYGNHDYVIDWELNGYRVKDYIKDKNPNVARGETHYFKPAVTWSLTSSSKSGFAARIRPMGFIFDINGMSSFPSKPYVLVGYLNSVVANEMLKAINPTMAFQVGDIKQLRLLDSVESSKSEELSKEAISIAKSDWDWSETSWDFKGLPLLIDIDNDICLLSERWFKTHEIWQRYKSKLLDVQKANNALFIDAYGLQDELMPEVPLNE
ncbi:MAG: BREX-1 system adenine-specific DNA-methyltransferase PglX, partial [Sphaerospermopsis kisseleviana]